MKSRAVLVAVVAAAALGGCGEISIGAGLFFGLAFVAWALFRIARAREAQAKAQLLTRLPFEVLRDLTSPQRPQQGTSSTPAAGPAVADLPPSQRNLCYFCGDAEAVGRYHEHPICERCKGKLA